MSTDVRRTCGQLIIGGFDGTDLPAAFGNALSAGERGGAILFHRNVTGGPAQVAALNAQIRDAAPAGMPPLVALDQEGGRVARLGAPLLVLPPMRILASRGDVALVEEAARAQGEELAALGFTMNFAPVLDVNTCPTNPIIGDRAFGDDVGTVLTHGLAFARGLARGGVLACGKHFPGHGDTTKDSHLDLPIVAHDRTRLDAVELAPFREAAREGIAAMMTAHVLYPALDTEHPATLSHAICTNVLRRDLGYRGWLVSDDLQMKAVADRYGVPDAAVRAIAAGCDAVLVCDDVALQERVLDALVTAAQADAAFRARCEEAMERGLAMRRSAPPRPVTTEAEIHAASARARAVTARLAGGAVVR